MKLAFTHSVQELPSCSTDKVVIHSRQTSILKSAPGALKHLKTIYSKRLRLLTRKISPKYLLCRPQGGWNDTLVQISWCLDYAVKHKRQLIIDTTRSGLLDNLDQYFLPTWPFRGIFFSLPSGFSDASLSMTCLPVGLAGRGINYESNYSPKSNCYDLVSKSRLSFDFNKSHPEQLLVHEQCGGGRLAGEFFGWASVTPNLRLHVKHHLKELPASYIAIHVRHTDVKTDFMAFFQAARPHTEGKNVLICTDSLEVLTYARGFFNESKVYSVSNIPDSKGASLHHNPDLTDWSVNAAAICDLFAMSQASAIIHPSQKLGYQSGFVSLAVALMRKNAMW